MDMDMDRRENRSLKFENEMLKEKIAKYELEIETIQNQKEKVIDGYRIRNNNLLTELKKQFDEVLKLETISCNKDVQIDVLTRDVGNLRSSVELNQEEIRELEMRVAGTRSNAEQMFELQQLAQFHKNENISLKIELNNLRSLLKSSEENRARLEEEHQSTQMQLEKMEKSLVEMSCENHSVDTIESSINLNSDDESANNWKEMKEIMQRLPIIPVLAPQFRASTLSYDNIARFNFRTKVKEYILKHFQADPRAYDEAFRELSDMKFEANNPSATIESSCKMKRYFGQLCMIQKRFPMSAGQELETPFAWFDSLSDSRHPNSEITHGDIEFEKASVMFNIGAAHAQIAANADRETEDSIEHTFTCTHLLDNEIRIMRSEVQRINHSAQTLKERVKENTERIKVNKTLPYLVSNVVELLDLEDNQEEEGANVDLDAQKTKCAVIKTSTRATYFLPVVGLVDPDELKPGDLVGVNKDSYLILEKLPAEYDSRVKAMEVDERPTEQYADIGGCDKQIQELIEAVVLPMTHKDRFVNLGIHPPKGVLMYGPPGTGKTMMARAVAAQTKSTFLKLAGPQLVQMFIGDGAKLVRDAFALAKEKAPAIIFIDELDAIGTKRFDSEKAGDREVQRTMLELLNQLDGFQPNDDIKVIAATNRIDVLDPALLRSGRLDRKIELPHPNEDARARIMQIHSRKMNVNKDVNFEELARCTDDFNGAQCKAVCVEAGMIALRRDATEILHEDFMDAILEVQAKKKASLNYYA